MSPSFASPGATDGATPEPGRSARITIGRTGEVRRAHSSSLIAQTRRAVASSGTITASGFASRPLRSLRRRTAASLLASHARWNPPTPLIATMRPEARSRRVSMSGSPESGRPVVPTSASCGPHAGQAFGWAWKRRSAGSSYSRRHASHIAKAAIVVWARS